MLSLETAIKAAAEAEANCIKEIEKADAACRAHAENAGSGELPDLLGLIDTRKGLEAENAELERQISLLDMRIAANKKIVEQATKAIAETRDLEERLKWLSTLADTAMGRGRGGGREQMMLETYVQTAFFDRIIHHANLRLIVMTDGQYELVRCKVSNDKRAQSGLDLDVIDHHNGSVRGAKSLSGGESFMASLALALGLSDEVQSFSGGVRLGTMFVDEGFGTLDERSLDQAMQALIELSQSDRLIGIISHVGQLKERIDKRIVVTKTKSGGSHVDIQID